MMTTDSMVRKEVLDEVKRMVRPGAPVTPTVWKAAYALVRVAAIKETLAWKKKYITVDGGYRE